MGIGSRSFLGLLWGAIGGGIGWLISDFWANPLSDPERMLHDLSPGRYWLWGALIGACMSGALAVADTLSSGYKKQLTRSVLSSALFGFIGGGTGLYLGGVLFRVLGGQSGVQHLDFLAYMGNCLLRAIAWTLAGLLLGTGYGLSQRSAAKIRNGAIGGVLGGFIGGLVFGPLTTTLPMMMPFISQSDRVSRLVALCLIGGLIGFFTALVGALLKAAWVLVVYGRNEGREFILEKPVSHIGRSELAEIPIYKDRLLAANHAEIRLLNGRYSLADGGSVVGSSVNGQKVAEPVLLKDSDLIQVGNTQIVFYERATAGPNRRQIDLTKAAPTAPAIVKEGACPFCGQQKNPVTGACACSVPQGAVSPPVQNNAGGGMIPEPLGGGWPPASNPVPFAEGTAPGPFQDLGVSPSSFRLVATAGPHTGETFVLTGTQVDAGRDAANAIPLVQDTTVSRKHATLRHEGGSWTLTDLGSSNGTFVNGVRIATQTLRPGDEVTLGTARFRVEA